MNQMSLILQRLQASVTDRRARTSFTLYDSALLLQELNRLYALEAHLSRRSSHDSSRAVTPDMPPEQRRVAERQLTERLVVRRAVSGLIHAGFLVGLDDGGDELALAPTNEVEAVMKAIQTVDDERLMVFWPHRLDQEYGWVQLIYGNDGWDVVADYTGALESVMEPVQAYANDLAEREAEA